MTIHITRSPMSRNRFDAILVGIGWHRDQEEAHALDDPEQAFISDIDLVPDADGTRRVMFETHRTEKCGRLIEAADCISENDPAFWAALGIVIVIETEGETA